MADSGASRELTHQAPGRLHQSSLPSLGSRRPPPYGRQLIKARVGGVADLRLNVFVMAGPRAWERALRRHPPNVLVLPPDESPSNYDWRCCSGLAVTVQGTEEPDLARLELLVHNLLSGGARHVAVLYREAGLIRVTHFRPDGVAAYAV